MSFAEKPHPIRYHLSLLAALAIGLFAIPAHATPTFVVSGGILDGIAGVVVDGSNYNVTFAPGSCVSLFNGCDSASDFAFTSQLSATDASNALASIFPGGTVNPAFPNGVVNSANISGVNYVDLLTPWSSDALTYSASFVLLYTDATVSETQQGRGNFYTSGSGNVFAVWTAAPTSVPEPWTIMLFGVGLAGAVAMRRRNKQTT